MSNLSNDQDNVKGQAPQSPNQGPATQNLSPAQTPASELYHTKPTVIHAQLPASIVCADVTDTATGRRFLILNEN